MREANEAEELLETIVPADIDRAEEFVLELSAQGERRVEGFVHHLQSGRREAVRQWSDVTEIISRILAETDARHADGA